MIRINLHTAAILTIVFTIFSSCSNLKRGEIVRVDHAFYGCFGSATNSLTMYEQSGSTFARLETDEQMVRDIKLSATQVQAFDSFINGLTNLEEDGGCTTVETYVVYTKDGIIRRTDGGCSWRGFENLKLAVFGKMEE